MNRRGLVLRVGRHVAAGTRLLTQGRGGQRGVLIAFAGVLAGATVAFGASTALAQGGPPQAVLSSLQAAGSNGLQLTGSVSSNGLDTSFSIQYGPSPALGESTPPTDVGSAGTGSCGCEPTPIQQPIFGLSPDTHYYVRIAATNSSGTVYSQTLSAWTQTSNGQPGGSSPGPGSSSSANDELVVRELPRLGLPHAGLVSVSCPSSSFCMAVGSFGAGLSTGSFFERWNGRSWRRTDVQRATNWLAVSCLSESLCMAVGTGPGARVAGARWNGRAWSRVGAFSPPPSAVQPGANPGEALQSLSCATPRDCWAVGYDYGRTLVEHWTGRSWSRSSAPVRKGSLISVSCASAGDCWAVSTPLNATAIAPLQFNGRAWQVAQLPGAFTQRRYQDQVVSCRTPVSCWVVGSSSASGSQPSAVHRTGSSWRMVGMPAPARAEAFLQALDCGSAGYCWALGGATVGAGVVRPSSLAEEWDGSAWHIATVTGPMRRTLLTSISCPTASFCLAVGGSAFAVTKPAQ
ncbi:MAG: hypothetical protein ACYC0H_12605 [Solirubrobacteraceae bacterium]